MLGAESSASASVSIMAVAAADHGGCRQGEEVGADLRQGVAKLLDVVAQKRERVLGVDCRPGRGQGTGVDEPLVDVLG